MTTEEFLEHISENGKYTFDWKEFGVLFARYHVEQALKAKVKAMTYAHEEDSSYSMNELDAFTKHAYPLENIK